MIGWGVDMNDIKQIIIEDHINPEILCKKYADLINHAIDKHNNYGVIYKIMH
jgi:hypothetical protein